MRRFGFNLIILLSMQTNIFGAQIVDIVGHYDVVSYIAGKPSKAQSFSADFVVNLSENSWRISAKKSENPSLWEELVYDGTNTYSLMPYEGHYQPNPTNKFFGVVTPFWRYNMTTFSDVNMFFPWLVYALAPTNITPEMPRPWGYIYKSLAGYGYRWSANASSDGEL